jgi:hypothetical protein
VLKRHPGIRKIVEDLYPDSAHFIFELQQNAEDRNASEVHFMLSSSKLRFEHNGETFRPQDIYAITDIGEGTKATDEDKIGRFGVGFKSVFAYSETPHIWSPTFSFKITELVLPSALPASPDLDGRTRFDFPFNNPKKAPPDACKEIETGLNELAETTLLFLRHIKSIKWHIEGGSSGDILRIDHSDHHVEMLKQIDGQTTTSAHFLKFDQIVAGLERQRVATAFALDYLPNVQAYSSDKPLSKQLKIVPVRGQVAVFFPAAKESSGLRFHLHAPFVPELSRASIKETPANKPLFDQLAALAASSLHPIRDLGLLTTEFLSVLPNPQDQLGQRYFGIRDSIIAAMNDEPLTPTYAKGHAPGRLLVQAKASLKELLGTEDLEFLIDYDDEPPQWAATRGLQGTNVERFMNGLAIENWDIEAFVDCIAEKSTEGGWPGVRPDFAIWLAAKSVEWHQQMYALLARESEVQAGLHRLRRCKIVRLVDGGYSVGSKCHFSDDNTWRATDVQCVDAAIYTAGKNKPQQDYARKFLEDLRVTHIGERHLVEAVLKGSYVGDSRPLNQGDYTAHMRRFMKLLDEDPSSLALLAAYPIFMSQDNKWRKASEIYLDAPYLDTGLSEYLAIKGVASPLAPLSDVYQAFKTDTVKVIRFVEKLGARTKLDIARAGCRSNPEWAWLTAVGGERYTSPIDQDYVLNHFSLLAARKSERLAKLVWSTISSLPGIENDEQSFGNPLWAVYRKNMQSGAHKARSHLVHQLRREAWVPQSGSDFVRPALARAELLPEGFTFDPGWPWIKAIEFGKNIQIQNERARAEAAASAERQRKEQEAAKALGFCDVETARRLAEIPPDELATILSERERRKRVELPDHEPANPDRRSTHVSVGAAIAPERRTESRERTVSIARDSVKAETYQYLRQQYTNADAEQICQICKDILPFKLDNGTHFFEAAELMPELSRHHYQNYLCLCPNHSAMFRHANGSRETLTERILQQVANELAVDLAQQELTIYFTKTHLADLKSIIVAERRGDELMDIMVSGG